MAESARKFEKLVVLIPTIRRPALLAHTVRAVAHQCRKYGDELRLKVEIVVSDKSFGRRQGRKETFAQANKRLLKKLGKEFPEIKIHYYGPCQPKPIRQLLEHASGEERRAYEELVPQDGHWGAHRNRLALLAVMHGGDNAAYLHLDDDTPPWEVVEGRKTNKRGEPMASINRDPGNVLDAFVSALEKAREEGKAGAAGSINMSARDAATSQDHWMLREPFKLRRERLVETPTESIAGHLVRGPGRILGYKAMRLPYRPRYQNEDHGHERLVKKRLGPYARAEFPATVLHLGYKGFKPVEAPCIIEYEMSKESIQAWGRLVDRMTGMKARK